MTIRRLMLSSVLASATAGGIVPTHAADLDRLLNDSNLPVTKPVEIGSGWYLRGDIGYSVSSEGDIDTFRTFDLLTQTPGRANWDPGTGLDADWSGAVGIGYQFNTWLRGDLTFDIGGGDFNSSATSPFSCDGFATGSCITSGSTDYDTYGFLASAYLDLGTYAGFTPYVGGGIGATYVDYNNYSANVVNCVSGSPCTPFGTEMRGADNDWRFTYALTAGISYDITRNLKIDAHYRYVNIDDGNIFKFSDPQRAAGSGRTQAGDDGLENHELRLGLRYEIW